MSLCVCGSPYCQGCPATETLKEEVLQLKIKVENLLRQNQDIAESNAEHVGRYVEMERQIKIKQAALIRTSNMLNTAVPHSPHDPDDPCPADCKRCVLEKRFSPGEKL